MSIKLNLGCGQDLRQGWVNADISMPKEYDWAEGCNDIIVNNETQETYVFLQFDATEEWPLANETVARIECVDLMEHIQRPRKVLLEAWRVLECGGRWRIEVPQWPGRRYMSNWDHVTPWTREKLERPCKSEVLCGHPNGPLHFHQVHIGPARGLLQRLREWWNWFDKPKLEAVYEKPSKLVCQDLGNGGIVE